MKKPRPDDDDEPVAFHAHFAYGDDEAVAVHVRGARRELDEITTQRFTPPAQKANVAEDAITIPRDRSDADREIARFVSMLDAAQREGRTPPITVGKLG